MSFLKQYQKEIVPELQKEFGIKNVNALPKIKKVVISCGIGTRIRESKDYSDIEEVLAKVSGQKPALSTARMSVSNFKLREGMPNGLKVTLRGSRMWDFLERLVKVALPRVRDFRGIPVKMDGRGNYNLGIKDYAIFPEANLQDISKAYGMQVTIATQNSTNEQTALMLQKLGFPFKK